MSLALAEHVQQVAVEAFGPHAAARLEELRPALRQLRTDYRSELPPDFSDPDLRAAYVLAYHPHHCVLAAQALDACGLSLLGIDGAGPIRVTVLGAGPAPEVVALAWLRRGSNVVIDATLVDREPGWERTRRTTIDRTVNGFGVTVQASHVAVDLATSAGRAKIAEFVRSAHLVVVQALLSELVPPDSREALTHYLLAHLGASGRLVVVDYEHRPATRQATSTLDGARDIVTLSSARFVLPAARPVELLGHYLFADEDGLIPRKKLECEVRVLARPGARPPASAAPAPAPTSDQARALAAFRQFLSSDQRIFVLRGTAGTGKTTMVAAMVREAEAHGLPVHLLAPTGRAAARLREVTGRPASTLHSQLYRFSENEDRGDDQPPLARFVLGPRLSGPGVHLVDEASLVGNRRPLQQDETDLDVVFGEGHLLADLLVTCLRHPGDRLVLIGDPNQLPPVGENTRPALDPAILAELSGEQPVVEELTEVVRQDDANGILSLALAWLHSGRVPAELADAPDDGVVLMGQTEPNPWLVDAISESRATVIASRNDDVREWNRRIRLAGHGDGVLVPGEKLLVVRTDQLHGVFNGDELDVVSVAASPETIRVKDDEVRLRRASLAMASAAGPLVFDTLVVEDLLDGADHNRSRQVNRVLFVDFVRRTQLRPGDQEFSPRYRSDERVNALRATFAYARTCHRAQGGEWDRVVVDFAGGPRARDGSWAYTALTRARDAVHLLNVGVPRFDSTRLAASATKRLHGAGLGVIEWRPIQGGVQLIVARGPHRVKVNLYASKGTPSTAEPTGPDQGGLHGVVVANLSAWIREIRAQSYGPLPEALEQLASVVADHLDQAGCTLDRTGDYQVQFTAIRAGNQAKIAYHFNAAGKLGREIRNSAKGDPQLLTELRAAVDAARG